MSFKALRIIRILRNCWLVYIEVDRKNWHDTRKEIKRWLQDNIEDGSYTIRERYIDFECEDDAALFYLRFR